jgi:preprotein translocase subunit SecA
MNAYDEREDKLGEELMRHLERSILLQVIDNRWREHLFDMDYLREGIHLRGFAQIDPLVAYKNEGFSMFEDLMHSIWEEFSKLVFHAEIEFTGPGAAEPYAGGGFEAGTDRRALEYSGGTMESQPSALEGMAAGAQVGPMPASSGGAVDLAASEAVGPAVGGEVVETVVKDEHDKLGRNDPCWCGSGKKYKKCHGS